MIIDLQRRLAEVGRIRIGQQIPTSNGKSKRPAKLSTFRLTSPNRTRIQHAAGLYGGTPAPWDAPAGQQWEVITETDALNVIVPPSDMSFSQHYELWSGGGCQRRCDGRAETISDGPCLCDPDRRECDIHTRLSVMIRDLPGLGVWRIDTSGYYAAVELQGAVEVVQMAAGRGQMLPAQLRLEQRMIKRPGQSVRRFAVPVLDIEVSPAQLIGGGPLPMVDGTPGTIAIEPARPREIDGTAPITEPPPPAAAVRPSPITPVPETVPTRPIPSIAEQAAAKKPSRRRAQSIPSTGIKPRTRAEAASSRREIPPPPEPPEPPDEPPDPTPTPQADDAPDEPMRPAQQRKLHAQFRDAKVEDREDRLAITSAILGFTVTTSNQLTVTEASKVIDKLTLWEERGETDNQIREILNGLTLAEEAQQS